MTEFVEVKTAQLEGAALDWAVAQVEKVQTTYRYGRELVADHDRGGIKLILSIRPIYSPSTNWSQGGPLIQKYGCDLNCMAPLNAWEANCWDDRVPSPGLHLQEAETPLIAACRAIVSAKIGDTVQVPKELLA